MEDDNAIDTRIFWYLNSAFCDVQHVIAFNDANHSHDPDEQILFSILVEDLRPHAK